VVVGRGSGAGFQLLDLAPIVVVKAGADGCDVLWRDANAAPGAAVQAVAPPGRLQVATTPLAADDTTGAGDAFDAGFLHVLLLARATGQPWDPGTLRRAAVSGHRAAADLLRRPRPDLVA
jgi:sugar/nucleoside kinase (ribokinase family)